MSQWANKHVYISNNGTNEYIQLQTDHKQMCGMKHITFFSIYLGYNLIVLTT